MRAFDNPASQGPQQSRAAGPPALVRKLERFTPLTVRDRHALAHLLSLDTRTVRSKSPMSTGSPANRFLAVMLDGWACSYRGVRSGNPQLVACHLPGDFCDLQSLAGPRPNTTIMLSAGARIARLSGEKLAMLVRDHPQIARALRLDSQIASSIEREWLVNVTRRDAHARIAHLLCEFIVRGEAVGCVENQHLPCPLTQADLANACGLTAVHTNRILRTLREDEVISWRGHVLHVQNRVRLATRADFCPAYLAPTTVSSATDVDLNWPSA